MRAKAYGASLTLVTPLMFCGAYRKVMPWLMRVKVPSYNPPNDNL
jgi:hypothetical protein